MRTIAIGCDAALLTRTRSAQRELRIASFAASNSSLFASSALNRMPSSADVSDRTAAPAAIGHCPSATKCGE